MTTPRFSVVIPTRDRADTLAFTLRTCLAQDFADYEVVVCDQGSGAVEELIHRCASPRLRYIRTPETCSSLDNWNLAIAQARGEFVMILGSDDALMPYAMRELDHLVGLTQAKLLVWPPPAMYIWPSTDYPEDANYLMVPLERHITRLDSREQLALVSRNEVSISTLPNVYHGLVHRGLIDALRERTGTVFATPFADSYAAVCFAYLGGSYTSVSVPMTVTAFSPNSFGAMFYTAKTKSSVYRETMQALDRAGIHHHRWAPKLPLESIILANSFQTAKEALFPDDDELVLDRKRLASAYVSGLWTDDEEERRELIGMIRDSLSDSPDLVAWFDSTEPMTAPSVPPFRFRDWGQGFNGHSLFLNADEFGVFDVAAAADLAARVLSYQATRIKYDLPNRAQQLVRVHQESVQRAKLIEQLDADLRSTHARVRDLSAELESTRVLARRLLRKVLNKAWRIAHPGPRRGAA
jgi:glycosyltransferase involved in cell wall biosynthesis